jgi:hypothetical protein
VKELKLPAKGARWTPCRVSTGALELRLVLIGSPGLGSFEFQNVARRRSSTVEPDYSARGGKVNG